MDPGSVSIAVRAASALAGPLVRKLFGRPGRGADLVHSPVRISGMVAWRGEQRTLTEKDVRKLVAELVDRAVNAEPHDPVIEPAERGAVSDALTVTLLALGEIGMGDAQAVRLGHRALARALKRRAPGADRYLSDDGRHLYNSLLEVSCLHILNFFSQRSTFIARTMVEVSRQLDEQSRQLGILLGRVPYPVQDANFEHRYAEHIASKYGVLQIFGLRLRHSEDDSWPLDTAYLSLEAETTGRAIGAFDPGHPAPVTPRRIEQFLPGQHRILLRGHAGSGKTTLLQWLAVTAARRGFPPELDEYNDCVPFVLQLRTLARRQALPSPSGFLLAAGSVLGDAQPDGWALRALESGRALLLIDGVDEVPQKDRERTREWLRELLGAYPRARCLVTVRPAAVQDGWLRRDGFAELTLLPMSRDDTAAFIAHWHEAARAECGNDTERTRLDTLQRMLTQTVTANRSIARLAENPLLCALICALHRDEQARLPHDRKSLYEAALELLLIRRDTHRSIEAPEGIDLSKEAQLRLLSHIAAWLILQNQSEAEQEDVVEGVLAPALPAIREAENQGTPQDIFRYLLLRSGVLHAPTEDSVAFIHRTFQDYLGAKALQETRYFNLMVRNAHDNQWEDVIRMAAAHADKKQCTQLLRKLIRRGDEAHKHRHRLHLLAAACLEEATELEPEVRRAVESRMAELIPPRTLEDSNTLAAAGSVVLDLLPKDATNLTDIESAAVVATLCRIGGESALSRLVGFRHHLSREVHQQLIDYWNAFECEIYARDILSHLPEDSFFTVGSPAQLRAIRRMGGRSHIHCDGPLSVADFGHLVPEMLQALSITNNPVLDELGFLTDLPRLRELWLSGCTAVKTLADLAGIPVTLLGLYRQARLEGLGALDTLDQLRTLALDLPLPWNSLDPLPVSSPLTSLYLGPQTYAASAVRGIGRFAALRHLSFFGAVRLSDTDRADLLSLPCLESLALQGESIAQMRGVTALPAVRHLDLTDADDAADLTPLRDAFPGLRRLSLYWRPGRGPAVDLTPLGLMEDLVVQVSNAAQVLGADCFPDGRAIVTPRPHG